MDNVRTRHDDDDWRTTRKITVTASGDTMTRRNLIAARARSFALRTAREAFGPTATVTRLGGYWCRPAPWFNDTIVIAYRITVPEPAPVAEFYPDGDGPTDEAMVEYQRSYELDERPCQEMQPLVDYLETRYDDAYADERGFDYYDD